MATGLNVADLEGLVNATLEMFGKGKVTDLASDLTDYVVMSKFIKDPDKKMIFKGGKSYKFNVTKLLGTNARHIGMYQVDDVNVQDSIAQGEIPYKYTQTSAAFDLKEKDLNNAHPEQILDHIKLRIAEEEAGMAVLMEDTFWVNSATTSNLAPFGLDYWVVPDATGATALADHGFNGGDPSGFTAGAAGLTVANYPKWQNYTGNYVSVSKDDLIKAMRYASLETGFKSPIEFPSYDAREAAVNRWEIYCGKVPYLSFEEVGEAQNENLGKDIDSMMGKMTFQGNSITYIPKLNGIAGAPVYMIDWGVMEIACQKGWFMRRNVKPSPTQNTVVQQFTELGWNLCCKNRRKQAVFTTEV